MVNSTELEIFYRDFHATALVLVNPTVGEIFHQDLLAKSLGLVNSTELEMFYKDFVGKALCTVLEILRPRGFRQCRAPSWFNQSCKFLITIPCLSHVGW